MTLPKCHKLTLTYQKMYNRFFSKPIQSPVENWQRPVTKFRTDENRFWKSPNRIIVGSLRIAVVTPNSGLSFLLRDRPAPCSSAPLTRSSTVYAAVAWCLLCKMCINFHILRGKKLFREMVEKGEPAQVIGCHRGIQELFVSFLQFIFWHNWLQAVMYYYRVYNRYGV